MESNKYLLHFAKTQKIDKNTKILITSNERIINFFETHPKLQFDSFLLSMINVFDNLSIEAKDQMTNSVQTQILNSIQGLQHLLANVLSKKLDDTKTAYLDDMRTIITNILLTNSKETETNISRLNEQFHEHRHHLQDNVAKIQQNVSQSLTQMVDTAFQNNVNILEGILPKQSEQVQNVIQQEFEQLKQHTMTTLQSLKPDTVNVSSLMNDFETRFNSLILQIMNASEHRLNTAIDKHKETQETFNHQFTQSLNTITHDLKCHTDFFDNYKNSSRKGAMGENNLSRVLSNLFPTANIIDTSHLPSSGDFILERADKPKILMENKDYTNNVPPKEIDKFIKDVKHQECHGIFLSQNSGITQKNHFEINILDDMYIVIYIHNVQYKPDVIHTAISIVDTLKHRILTRPNTDMEGGKLLQQEDIDSINQDINAFIEKRDRLLSIMSSIQTSHKELYREISSFDIPHIINIITNKQDTTCFTCDICNAYKTNQKMSLAAHKRHCIKKVEK
jgi:hypothetical protein